MKKTLAIVLSLVAGIATGASVPTLNSAEVAIYNWQGTSTTLNFNTVSTVTPLTLTTDGKYVKLTAGSGKAYSGTETGTTYTRSAFTLTLVIDFSKLTAPESGTTNIATFTNTSEALTSNALGIGYNSSSKVDGTWKGSEYSSFVTAALTSGVHTITLVTGIYDDTNSTEGSRIYVDNGETFYSSTGLKSGESYTTLLVNASLSSAIQQLYIFNDSKTADEVATICSEVKLAPEPATATLSLLALAGLAARRRRH